LYVNFALILAPRHYAPDFAFSRSVTFPCAYDLIP
jgi:hypothetical protein